MHIYDFDKSKKIIKREMDLRIKENHEKLNMEMEIYKTEQSIGIKIIDEREKNYNIEDFESSFTCVKNKVIGVKNLKSRLIYKSISNKTIKYKPGYSTEGSSYSFASTENGTGFAPRLRITFSFSNGSKYSSSDYFEYYKGSYSAQKEKPTSPVEVDVISNDTQVLGIMQVSPYKFRAEVYLYKNNDTSNNRVTFDLKGEGFSDISSSSIYYVSMTITKIEQYYE